MEKIILVNKHVGETPLQAIIRLKSERPDLQNVKIGYAGRLDPMAEGLLLLLIEGEAKKRDYYQKLPKKYEFTALFGLETDSYDILGKLKDTTPKIPPQELNDLISDWIYNLPGKFNQIYPPFSSIRVKGKPLYWWVRHGKYSEIEVPQREVEIFEAKLLKTGLINSTELTREAIKRINLVQGDFRQNEIIKGWQSLKPNVELKYAKFEVSCSSGTYIRSLIHQLGVILGCGALSLSIKRTQIGSFRL